MIRILKQRVTNFASYQSPAIPYDGETTLIGGRNGAGKSTFLEAMRYAFGNKDLQHSESDRVNYYLQRGNNKITGSTVTLSNRDANSRPAAFKHLGIKAEAVTVGVVFAPQSDGSKKGKYGILPGDVPMQEFVEEVKRNGHGWREHLNKLSTCHLGKDVIDHVMVKQGTAGDLAKASPRELYLRVLAQGGHVEVKERYEEAVEESNRAHNELEARRLERDRAIVQYEAAVSQVAALDRYEAQVAKEKRLENELEGARLHRLVREQARLQRELDHAKKQLEVLPNQIVTAGSSVDEAQEDVRTTTQLINDYEGAVRTADDALEVAKDAAEKALREMDEAVRKRSQWQNVQYAPSPDEARERQAQVEKRADDARRELDALTAERNRLQGILDGINGCPDAPADAQAMLDAVPGAKALPSSHW